MLNDAFNHFIVKLDVPGYGSLVLHYTHTQASNSKAVPLLFSHGWPGSFVEAIRIVEPLTNPENAESQAFHVVAPSIPGFGFSPAPMKSGVGPNVVARAYKILMTEVLGYPKFVTQGGDFGSFITRSIAIQYPEVVAAQHLNMFPVPPPTIFSAPVAYLRWCFSAFTYSTFEHKALKVRRNFEHDQSGYLEQQKTRPQTLGFALGDSPVGLLAWFVEKIHDWADVHDAFSDDDMITLVMMHWIQGATPALRFYREAFGRDMREAEKTFESYVSAPTGVSMYAKEQLHVRKHPHVVLPGQYFNYFCSVHAIGLIRSLTFSSGVNMRAVVTSHLWSVQMLSSKIFVISFHPTLFLNHWVGHKPGIAESILREKKRDYFSDVTSGKDPEQTFNWPIREDFLSERVNFA
jgi:pimeloyl-ACP methyl ester carboxylesterase